MLHSCPYSTLFTKHDKSFLLRNREAQDRESTNIKVTYDWWWYEVAPPYPWLCSYGNPFLTKAVISCKKRRQWTQKGPEHRVTQHHVTQE